MSSDSLAIIDRPGTGIIEAPGEAPEVTGLTFPKRHIPLVAVCTLLGAAAAVGITSLQSPLYTAQSSVQIEQQAAQILGSEPEAGVARGQDAERQLNTQLELLRSRALAARVATDLGLVRNPRFDVAMGAEPAETPAESVGGLTEATDRAAGMLASNISVSLPKDSSVAEISFTSGDPRLSATVANAYAHGLIRINLERRFASSDYARNYLSGEVGKARSRLEGSERALNEYARSAGIINLGGTEANAGSGTVTQSTLLQLNQALSNARAQRIEAEQRLRASSASPLLSLPEVVNNNAVQQLLTERAAQEVTLAETRQRYTEEHPTAVVAGARVRQIDQQLQGIASSVRNSLEMQYRAARGQEAALAGQVASLKGQSLAEQDRSVRYNLLRHEVDTNRAMYDLLLQRQREVSTSAGVLPNNISVLDEAVAPGSPSYPTPLLNLIAGLFLGFIFGVLLAMLRELLDDRVRSTDEVERKLGLTTLGQIPLVRGMDQHALIASLDDPDSELGMHYTAFRTSLLFSTRRGLPKTIAITSSGDSEGKSTTALATARSLASAGKQVLLIEADMRRKSITEMLQLQEGVGLSALLTGQADFAETVQKTNQPNLDVISGGLLPPNPADILDPERFRAILNYAARAYDCVIIDAPPVADLADAPLIAAAAQNVVFVVAANANHRGRAKAALRRLRATGATILGVALTKAPLSRTTLYRYRRGSLRKLGNRIQERLAAA